MNFFLFSKKKTIGRDANFTANVRVRKRMELLKRLVPGSELIDNNDYLIKETLDYIYCLSPSAS